MNSVKRFIATTVLSLARFLDTYFWQLAVTFTALAVYNFFFIKNYDKILFESARDGKITELKDALKNDGDVNSLHVGDCTPLVVACGTKQEEAARIIIETGKCKIDTVDGKGRSALLVASGAGIVDTVKLLLKNKADIKSTDNNGSTPLIVACLGGHAEVVRALLAFGAEPRWKNKQGMNALAAAIGTHKEEGGRIPVIKELLSYSFKKNLGITESRNVTTGWTPLIRAAYKGYLDVVKVLLEYDANIHATGKKGFTALIAASQNGWTNVVIFLLDRGADPLAALEDGSTALVAASSGGYHEIVDLLIRTEAKCLDVCFKNGSTPLMTAALNGYLSVVQVLLAHKADVNALNDDNWSALAVAAQKGCLQISALLLEAGAVVDATTDRGYTPLMLAVKSGHFDLVKLLVRHGAQVNHFIFNEATEALDMQRIPLLYGYLPPLMLAINRGDLELVRYLFEQGADVYLDLALLMTKCEDPKNNYTAAAHEALKRAAREAEEREARCRAEMERSEPSQRLVTANAFREAQTACEAAFHKLEVFQEEQAAQHDALKDATLVYTYFGTPLLFAVYWHSLDVINLLLEHAREKDGQRGVQKMLAQTNTNGHTPLALAFDYGSADVALLLLKFGAPLLPVTTCARFAGKMLYRWRAVALTRVLGQVVYEVVTRRTPPADTQNNASKLKEE